MIRPRDFITFLIGATHGAALCCAFLTTNRLLNDSINYLAP